MRLIVHDGAINPLGEGDWRGARAAIGAFYANRGFKPVWIDETGLTAAGRAALAQLQRAPEDGLNLSALDVPSRVEAGLPPNDLAQAETAIAEAVVAYAEQASGSRVAPWRISHLVSAERNVVDPGVALAETALAPDPGARLAEFNPPQKGYRALRDALKRLAEAQPRSEERPGRAAINLDIDAFAEQPMGDIAIDPGVEPESDRPRGRKKRAAPRRAYALGETLSPGRARERVAILANMEMWRWQPRDMGERRIEVNVPDYSVEVLEGDEVDPPRPGRRRQAGDADTDLLEHDALRADQSVVARAGLDHQEGDDVATRLPQSSRIRGEDRSTATSRCVSFPEKATHWAASPSCFRTIFPSTCTTRPRKSCSTPIGETSATAACASKTQSGSPNLSWDGHRSE